MKQIAEFWLQSYRSDPTAFVFEMISFIFTVSASLYLALNAKSPNMLFVYPGFFVGSITQLYASYRRRSAWIMLITFYFAVINVFGFGVASSWW
jgi:hypothetical protein